MTDTQKALRLLAAKGIAVRARVEDVGVALWMVNPERLRKWTPGEILKVRRLG
jgi:hypothetical protein